MAATMKPASASASATSRWPTKEPPKPCEITTSGRSRPAMAQSFAARTVNRPTAISPGCAAQGYQTPPASAGPASGTSIVEKPAAMAAAGARAARQSRAKPRIELVARARDHVFGLLTASSFETPPQPVLAPVIQVRPIAATCFAIRDAKSRSGLDAQGNYPPRDGRAKID